MQDFKKLNMQQNFHLVTLAVPKATEAFLKNNLYELIPQILSSQENANFIRSKDVKPGDS